MSSLGIEAIKQCDPYWSLNENWGNPGLVDPNLIYTSCEYRKVLNHRLHISPIEGAVYSEGGHADKSWHRIIPGRNNLSKAMDVFPECDLAFAWITALRFPFGGVGVYPFAEYPAKRIKGMLHLDMRPYDRYLERALWWRDDDGKYHWLREQDDVWELLGILSR